MEGSYRMVGTREDGEVHGFDVRIPRFELIASAVGA